ncbi:MAG: nuclear transport factor 2 family protein [Alphaproteobacteria bacterium]|nr:nuclear transport factor 2 family protein [Alphaproteobacteria bacterium]
MRQQNDHPAFLLLQDFCHFYTERNIPKIIDLFSTHQKIFILGTGIDETRFDINGLNEQLERDWSQSESGTLTLDPNVVTSSIDAFPQKAWAYGVCTAEIIINGQKHRFTPLRGSLFATLEDNQWKIEHIHSSFPSVNQEEGQSFPIEKVA